MARRPVSFLGSMETSWRRKGYWENQNGGEQYYFFHFFVIMSFWASVMCQEETSESLEGVSPGGVINHGKNLLKRFDSLYKLRWSSKFPGA